MIRKDGNTMVRRRIGRALCCMIALLALPAALLFFAFGLPPQYGETFLGELPYKIAALSSAPQSRIVIVGGSSVAFGLRSDLLEMELPGYDVINMGMYAGLGSTVMPDLAAEDLRAGDVVLFSPEQSSQTLSLYFNAESMWQAADGHFALLRRLPYRNWGAMVGQFPYFAAQKARFFLDGNPPAGEGIYTRSAFNAWGDIDHPLRIQNVMTGGYDPNMPISFDPELPTDEFIAYINDYAAMCEARGVSFYYAFCPMNAAAISQTDRLRVKAYQEYLERRLDCPILGQAEESIYDAGWFYDTNFHLNSAGAIMNTIRLAGDLKPTLGLDATVSIAPAQKPGMAEADIFDGDDSDAGCFLYEKTADGVLLTGLTAQGAEKKRLILPTRCEGSAVTGFSASVFSENTQVEQIVIQANIRTIADGSFNGCIALTHLIMENASPSDCSVGDGLLTGTSASVYVPAQSIGAYKTNYFWTIHAARIRAQEAPIEESKSAPSPMPKWKAKQADFICYEGNGGVLFSDGSTSTNQYLPLRNTPLRVNTLQGTNLFVRKNHVLMGWNTAADGSGLSIGLGSRITPRKGLTLYAQWLPTSAKEDFTWTLQENQVFITGYTGSGALCVIPPVIEGFPVRRVCADAFRGADMHTLVLPPTLYTVEKDAFSQSTVQEIYLHDSLYYIHDESFSGCDNLTTLHINAVTKPVYSISYYATFADKYDWLLSLAGKKKLVLFSGSSTRYGYDSVKLRQAFKHYQVANMGVYAYTNALPQMELIRQQMQEGDALLHAPEFDTLHNQLCGQNALDEHFWAMMEANYDMVSKLDLRDFTEAFDSLHTYLLLRADMPKLSYDASPNGYDDDGNQYLLDTYNQYGDFILPRPNGTHDVLLQHMRANYTVTPYTEERLAALNREYQKFLDKGVAVYFAYTPRNRSSLTPESTPQARAELDQWLREELIVPVITDIESSLYSGIYFFIIDSHLSDEGVSMHTEKVINALRPWLDEGL